MELFRRLFRWGRSEAHAAMNKLEDPIKMAEQGLRELRKDLEESLKGLAEIKALTIRSKREADEKKQLATDYEKKAMLLLDKGQKGSLDTAEAERLASNAVQKKDELTAQAVTLVKNQKNYEQMMKKLEVNIKDLKSQISSWEAELKTLKARAKVAGATKKLNKQLAQTDSSGTIAMLEKMKDRISEEEALAESYGEIASTATSVDDEINKALGSSGGGVTPASDSLAQLKAKMGIK